MRRTPKVIEGLTIVRQLATADAQVDPERFPPDHPVWDGIEYIHHLTRRSPRKVVVEARSRPK